MTDHIEEWLSPYLDEELEEADRIRVASHLETCAHCHAVYEDLIALQNQIMATYGNVSVSDDLEQRILHAVNSEGIVSKQKSYWPEISIASLTSILFIGLVILFGTIGFRIISVFGKVFIHLVYVLGSVLTSLPGLAGGTIAISVFLLITSWLFLNRLLRTKVV